MNLPNKLTVTRLVMVPVFFIAFLIGTIGTRSAEVISTVLMVICYLTAELSDLLDGKIARKHNLVTDLGKVLDPFADTLSHLTFFVCFLSLGIMPVWSFIIIMWREFSILFLRMLMMRTGKAMPANIWGKSKTVFYALTTFLSIVFMTAKTFGPSGEWIGICQSILYVFFALAALASLMSFITYLYSVFKSKALSGMTR